MTAPVHAYDVLAMGRCCIDLYAHQMGVPITGVKSFDAYVGGCPTNVAVGTRRLGLRTALLSAVGDDQVGDFVLNFLDIESVDARFVVRKRGRRTSAVILTIEPPDRFPLTYYRDNCADGFLNVSDVEAAPAAESRVLFVTGTGLSCEPSLTATHYAVERSRTAGNVVVFDLDYRPALWPDAVTYGAAVRALMARSTIVIGTEEEVAAAAGETDIAAAVLRLHRCGAVSVVVKRGQNGSSLYRVGTTRCDAAPFPVDVVNTIGAGDAFASGFLRAWLCGWPLEHALRFGNASGAIVVTRHGCANDMPMLADVEAFVAARGGWELECMPPRS